MACIFQLLIEFLFYETTECVIMNFFIPELARNEIQAAAFSLRKTLQFMIIGDWEQHTTNRWILDAPAYLFTST